MSHVTEQVGDWEFCTSQYSLPSPSFFIFGCSVLCTWILLFLLFGSESDSSIDAERFLFVKILAGREFFFAICEVRFMIDNRSVCEMVMPWKWVVIDRRYDANRGTTRSETRLSLISRESWHFVPRVPQPLLRGICGVVWPHSLATVPLCQLVRTPEPISSAY